MARFFPALLLLLAGCFDGATTKLTLDLRAGTATVAQRLHNAWPDEVGCTVESVAVPTDACVAGVRARVAAGRADLEGGGATVTRAGIVLDGGKLDLVFDYTAPVGGGTLEDQGLMVMWMDESTPAQVAKGKPGKRRVALVDAGSPGGKNDVRVDGAYRLLHGTHDGEDLRMWLFRGKSASVVSEWVYSPGADGAKSPGAWLAERPGLTEALAASGLVIAP